MDIHLKLTLNIELKVIGAGPIGIFLASELNQFFPNQIQLFDRREEVKKTFQLERPDSTKILVELGNAKTPITNHVIKFYFFAVKAYDLQSAIDGVVGQATKGSVFISLNNGYTLDLMKSFAEKYPDFNWRMGTVNFGAKFVDEFTLRITNPAGKFIWGPIAESKSASPEEKQFLGQLPSHFFWTENPLPAIRQKWLFNTVINSLSVTLNASTNGVLLQHQEEISNVFSESYRLGQLLWGNWPSSESEMRERLFALIQQTSENENSMYRDHKLGKKTESKFLAGILPDHLSGRFPRLAHLGTVT